MVKSPFDFHIIDCLPKRDIFEDDDKMAQLLLAVLAV